MSDKTPYDIGIVPREHNLLLELDEIPTKTAGGIYMSQEQSTPTRLGLVLVAGPDAELYQGGDRVLISSISGEPLYLWQYGMQDGKFRIVDERSVLGKVIKE